MKHQDLRINHLDPNWIYRFVETYEKNFMQNYSNILIEKVEASQTRYAMINRNLMSLCFFLYAAGRPFNNIYNCINKILTTYREVLQRRGSESSGRIDIPIPKDFSQPFDISNFLDQAGDKFSSEKDYSLGNSYTTLLNIYFALSIGKEDIAQEYANHLWDPDDADYIGINSEICTPNQQHLAYALRECLLNNSTDAARELKLIETPMREILLQANILDTIIRRDREAFINYLNQFLHWHAKESQKKDNVYEPDFLFCLPAVGLAGHALHTELVLLKHLPSKNPYLPLELLTLA